MSMRTRDDRMSEKKAPERIRRQLDYHDPSPIALEDVRKYVYEESPSTELRPITWMILLGYYKENKFKTESTVKRARAQYEYYKKQAIQSETSRAIKSDMDRAIILPKCVDGEVRCSFLDACLSEDGGGSTNRDAIESILVTFRYTNPGIRYVQGMNILAAVIFYVFSKAENRSTAEADTFFCFTRFVAEMSDRFVERMNTSAVGIGKELHEVMRIVKRTDSELYEHMVRTGVAHEPFHLRWVLLCFAREFNIDDVVWIWDKFLGDPNRFELVLYCAAARILLLKSKLMGMGSSFAICIDVLQHSKDVDIVSMFNTANELRSRTAGSACNA